MKKKILLFLCLALNLGGVFAMFIQRLLLRALPLLSCLALSVATTNSVSSGVTGASMVG